MAGWVAAEQEMIRDVPLETGQENSLAVMQEAAVLCGVFSNLIFHYLCWFFLFLNKTSHFPSRLGVCW